ncbi:hypothetical protein ETAA8_20760 [Anatilimnocola aggregata]|uniref:Uncharacterized protein n=1 Tax=Anatilimnocola aggregata TaxID=2528021 RepID=A0A517YA08_9BACT|nr:YwqG family protein [Anatilimnocola aggregata]QDU26992.1 hypothetical protein ETAA8_20760 [Anatilimnocola aggregata]
MPSKSAPLSRLSPQSRKLLKSLIRKHALAAVEYAILSAAEEYVLLILNGREDYSVLGSSRYGGVPDLPVSMPWPRSERGFLTFLMQVNLAEVPKLFRNPLPKKGLLYFFVEDDTGAADVDAKIVFVDAKSVQLKKAKPPSHEQFSRPDYLGLKAHKLRLGFGIDVPSYFSPLFQFVEKSVAENGLGTAEDRLVALVREAARGNGRYDEAGQLLGSAFTHGGDPCMAAFLHSQGKLDRLYDSQYQRRNHKSIDAGARQWKLLWTIGSSRKVKSCFGDFGSLQAFINTEDLKRQDFSRTYFSAESS